MISIIFIVLWLSQLYGGDSFHANSLQQQKVRSSIDSRLFQTNSEPASTLTANSAVVSMIRKGKRKYIQDLKQAKEEQGADHFINKFLTSKERPNGVLEPVNLLDSIQVKRGSLNVIVEYNKKVKNGFVMGLPPPEIMGGVYRDAGAKSVIVSLDPRSGGVTFEEFERFTREQSKAKLFVPKPISVLWHDFIVDRVQIEHAAALGAAGIFLTPDILEEDLPTIVKYCYQLGVEPIVFAKNFQEANTAIASEAKCIALHSQSQEELLALRTRLPSPTDRPDLKFIARLRAEADFSLYEEIDAAWLLRDYDFNLVWPSPEAIYATDMGDVYTSIQAMRAKASRKFLSPRQFLMDRKNEGATEYLGDILY